ncbi:hypothetical protein [Lederbergia citrisecunda]|uniref:hypothetical protein n=1 Tax=Lederbergia citrisecunda TaxID=2833583 RepID=UPI003D2877AF
MGSRIMRAIIAHKITEKLSIKENFQFLIGGVALDAVSSKYTSNFFAGDMRQPKRKRYGKEFRVNLQ